MKWNSEIEQLARTVKERFGDDAVDAAANRAIAKTHGRVTAGSDSAETQVATDLHRETLAAFVAELRQLLRTH